MMLLSGMLYISIEMCSTIILPVLYIKIQFLGIMYQSNKLLQAIFMH